WFLDSQIVGAGSSLNVQEAGAYTLLIEDQLTGCMAEGNITVFGDPEGPSDMLLEENPPLCFGQNTGSILITEITGGNAPYQYQLNGSSPGDQSIFTGLSPGVYTLAVIDATGCSLE
ncbi:SprB repeat-containing protein, partial [Arthrospira platensis SPKY1]|nr:SprB repeat-containing protein [Arthrospira platensis SPKY1]